MTSASPNQIATEYTIPKKEDVEVIEGPNNQVSHPQSYSDNNNTYNSPENNRHNRNNPKSNSRVNESSALVHPGSS
ncbi:MAG: hypothetical protein F6K34_08055, partial [Okeania sp. SIO4D6]|nr:hypothetical protein [Okeania sp. SIO4D6]